jgi:3-hydroxybutyryl-CoA dehydrogenase
LALATKRPDKVVGMHFFSPAQIMKLVEIIKGLKTSDETAAVIRGLAEKVGKGCDYIIKVWVSEL